MMTGSLRIDPLRLRNTLILVLTALIWGFGFVAQSVGAEHAGAFSFLAVRTWLAVAVILPWALLRRGAAPGAVRPDSSAVHPGGDAKTGGRPAPRLCDPLLVRGGCVCGLFLFTASLAQQAGVALTTTAKAGFLTTLYILLVPFANRLAGRPLTPKTLFCAGIGVAGMYFLCIRDELVLQTGDSLVVLCALLYCGHILVVDRYSPRLDVIMLSCAQLIVTAVLATAGMFLFESPALDDLLAAAPSLLYAGLLSSGAGYTLQVVGQKNLDPAVASLAMSLESVFSALGGWLVLGQGLTLREGAGCLLMFLAVTLSQLPDVTPPGRRPRARDGR